MNDINKKISNVLLFGVMLSVIFILLGILLAIINNDFTFNYTHYNLELFVKDIKDFNSVAFLMIGIFILVITPIIRIMGMCYEFIIQKNYIYVVISIIILIILSISLTFGLTHH